MGSRRGFTVTEMIITLAVASLVLAMVARPAATFIAHTRVNHATQVIAGDLDLARSLAARQRQPIRISFDAAAMQYVVTSRNDGTVLLTRGIGLGTDFKIPTARFTPSAVDFFPNGAQSAALTVTVGGETYAKRVTMTRVGLIRVPT